MSWNPQQYLRFADHRLRPGLDLLARVPLAAPRRIVDLGCGTGSLTQRLAARWPEAAALGVDDSEAMLAEASAEHGGVHWQRADIGRWAPAAGEAPDLIYSNAALHWLPDHAALLPRLLGMLAPGGCLAVQMPQSWGLPSHRLMRETLAEGGVGGAPLGPVSLRERMAKRPVGEAAAYHELLAPLCRSVDIWETVYMQVLTGEDPVLEWVMGSGLRPILAGLEPADRRRFLEVYRERLRVAYPAGAEGGVPYPFQRLFIVACS